MKERTILREFLFIYIYLFNECNWMNAFMEGFHDEKTKIKGYARRTEL